MTNVKTIISNARTLLVVYLKDFLCFLWQSFIRGHQDEKKLHQLQKPEVWRCHCEAPLTNPQHVSFLSHHWKLWFRQILFPSLSKPCRVSLLSKLISVINCSGSSLGNPHNLMKMDWLQTDHPAGKLLHGVFRSGLFLTMAVMVVATRITLQNGFQLSWLQSSQPGEQFHAIFRTGSPQVVLIWVDFFVTIWTVLLFSWHISYSTAATSLVDP